MAVVRVENSPTSGDISSSSGSRKRGEELEKEVPSLTQPLQEEKKEEEKEVIITLEYTQE